MLVSLMSLLCLSSVSLMSLLCLSSVSLLSLFCLSYVSLLSLFCLSYVSLLSLFCLSYVSLMSLTVSLTVSVSVPVSMSLSICLCMYLSASLSASLSMYLFMYLSIHMQTPLQLFIDYVLSPTLIGNGKDALPNFVRLLPAINDWLREGETLQAFGYSFLHSAKMLTLLASLIKAGRVRRRLRALRRRRAQRRIIFAARRYLARRSVERLHRKNLVVGHMQRALSRKGTPSSCAEGAYSHDSDELAAEAMLMAELQSPLEGWGDEGVRQRRLWRRRSSRGE